MSNWSIPKVLYVDLTAESFAIKVRKDLGAFLGGVGLATKLFEEELIPDGDPYDPAQPIIFAIGPMSTVYPVVTKAVCMFKSPLTKELGESYAGMRLAMAMRFSGYSAIVIKGKAKAPVYLSISPNRLEIKDGRGLWGLSVEDTGKLLRRLESGSGHRSALRIGPAGEKRVAFAGINVDTYRHFGRLGSGAILGSKNVKAIVIHGDLDLPISNKKEYQTVYKELYDKVTGTDIMEKYHGLGTTGNVLSLNAMGALPTRNLQESSFEAAEQVSGEAFAKDSLVRKLACSGCPVGCIHIGMLRREFAEGHEYESIAVSYDHELVFALGTLLGMTSQDKIYALIEKVEQLGLDAISAGVMLAWLTEAQEKGLVSEEEVGVKLTFDGERGYEKALELLVAQENELYRALAQGTWHAAQKFGGEDFALVLGKNEIAGYHTGYGNIVGQALGARHSHLDNAGYAIDQAQKLHNKEEMVRELIKEEEIRCVLNSLCICLFARKVYDLATVEKALKAIGINYTEEDLLDLGKEVFKKKWQLKLAMGYDLKHHPVPKRFTTTNTPNGKLDPETLRDIMDHYGETIANIAKA